MSNLEPYSTPETFSSALCAACGRASDVLEQLAPIYAYRPLRLRCGHVAVTAGARRYAIDAGAWEMAAIVLPEHDLRQWLEATS